jgi:hypothetical protein
MQNSVRLEKSRGIVAFATNTATTDYISIANRTLKLASHFLKLPYTLITDVSQESWINNRYDVDQCQFVEWKNIGRHTAYQLSPYDETLVIDVDYLVLDDSLLTIFQVDWDYMLQRRSHTFEQDYPNSMGPHSLPFVWATVFTFRKNTRSAQYFDLINRIQFNYSYYRDLFNLQERNYRNDYAFAMADIILNGYTVGTNSIPGSMLTIDKPINSIEISGNNLIVRDQDRAHVVPKTNLHVMSKRYLQSDNFREFVDYVTA